MKTTRNVRIGKHCKKHPEIKGLRYAGNSTCVECAKEQSRKHYASLEMTPAQKITTLLAEVSRLKDVLEAADRYLAFRHTGDIGMGWQYSGVHPQTALKNAIAIARGEQL